MSEPAPVVCDDRLTSRDRHVMPRVGAGLLHTQIAAAWDTSDITINIHRGQVMHKRRAASVAALVRMATRVGLPTPRYEPPYTNV